MGDQPVLAHDPANHLLRRPGAQRRLDPPIPVSAPRFAEHIRDAAAQSPVLIDPRSRVVVVVAAGRDTAARRPSTSANTSASAGRPASSSPCSTGAAGRRPGLFTAPNRLPHQRVLQLQLPYPPAQLIRVVAQQFVFGSGLRHGVPPFRSPAPPFRRRGTVSSNDAPRRCRRQVLRPPASAACRTGTAPPRDAASPTVWEAWERRRHTVDRHAATAPGTAWSDTPDAPQPASWTSTS